MCCNAGLSAAGLHIFWYWANASLTPTTWSMHTRDCWGEMCSSRSAVDGAPGCGVAVQGQRCLLQEQAVTFWVIRPRKPTIFCCADPPATEPEQAAVLVNDGTFSWDASGEATLQDITLQIPAGALAIVVGEVGCGKSSLLSAVLREMRAAKGKVTVLGTVAYTAQDPWIQNCTVEGNILMGMPMRAEWYAQVVAACALQSDLATLPAGDQTEIGEKGVNLSGALPLAIQMVLWEALFPAGHGKRRGQPWLRALRAAWAESSLGRGSFLP
jgi:hypothetical protein